MFCSKSLRDSIYKYKHISIGYSKSLRDSIYKYKHISIG